jgi:hypothetical protein
MGRRRRRFAGAARVFGYAMCVSTLGALGASRAVYASFGEGALHAGRELEGLGDALGGTKTIFLNGAAMNVSTAFTDQAPGEVLDRFEAVCRNQPEFLVRALSDLPATLLEKAHVTPDRIWRLGIVRHEEGGEGVLTCFTDDRPASLHDIADRVHAFEHSKDLAEFGHFHYVYVKKTSQGTHVRALWTEGEFNLGKLFPTEGDAEGFDSGAVPRPPNARRILSVTSAQVPYGVHVYRSTESEKALRSFYASEMAARGWQLATAADAPMLGYVHAGAMAFLTFGTRDDRTFVTTTETARQPSLAVAKVDAQLPQ